MIWLKITILTQLLDSNFLTLKIVDKEKSLTCTTAFPYNLSGTLKICVQPAKQNSFIIRVHVAGYETRIDFG